jgi:hypothetical protein
MMGAIMNAARIAAALAAPRRAKRLADSNYLVRCPVPSHGKGRGDRSPSLQISDGNKALVVYCHAGCDSRDVLAELRRRHLIEGSSDSPRRHGSPPAHDTDKYKLEQQRKAAWLWAQCKPLAGTPAERYLRSRGITCALPATLGFLPPNKPEHHPALISAFTIPDEPEPGILGTPRNVLSIHLTLLKPDGSGKADVEKPKLIVGSPHGLPIVLAPPNDLLGLAITEGIEDALTAHAATGLGAWAAGAAGFMPKLAEIVPSYIEAVTVYAHADEAGQNGARELATALRRRRIEIVVEGL